MSELVYDPEVKEFVRGDEYRLAQYYRKIVERVLKMLLNELEFELEFNVPGIGSVKAVGRFKRFRGEM